MAKQGSLGKKLVFHLVLFGFIGQLAWAVENVVFNTFLFNYIGGTTRDISRMVALSAVTAVVTTFIMGTLSDKCGRKLFLAGGYLLWGVVVMLFGGISRDSVARIFSLTDEAAVVTLTVTLVIALDCLMTFMGSTANDAAFSAWVTENTLPENRGKAEGLMSLFPVFATGVTMGLFGLVGSALTYPMFFVGLGALVTLSGIVGLLTLKETAAPALQEGSYFANLFYGFRPSVIRENAKLYRILLACGISGIALQIFFPYLFIYIQHFLLKPADPGAESGFQITPAIIVLAVVAVAGIVAIAVGAGVILDKFGKRPFLYPSIAVMLLTLAAAYFPRSLVGFLPLGVVAFAANAFLGMILGATIRDLTPEGKAGQFQGVRMIFFVLLPMVIGPVLGNAVIEFFAKNHSAGTYINEFGSAVLVPVPEIFPAAAIAAALMILPLLKNPIAKKEK